jgi:hypothetical protein
MQKIVKNIFWTSLLCVGCFFVAWNVHLIFLKPLAVVLAILPEKVEFQTPFVEGSKFHAEFTLENKTYSDLVIKKILSSCGCTGLFTKEGNPIEVPMVLSPSQSFPISVSVDTKNLKGKGGVSMMVLCEHKGKPIFSVGNILFEVAPQDDVGIDINSGDINNFR